MHPFPEELDAFARGEIDEPQAAAIEDHLATCPTCTERLEPGSVEDRFITKLRQAGREAALRRGAWTAATPFPSGYELIETIARGGMGIVFKARQRSLGRVVALKQIRAGLNADAEELARFRIEAEAAAKLRHPNIVQVFDVGLHGGLPYLAMELLDGGTLADRLAAGPLPPLEAATLVEAVARAIHHAHEAGFLHRDLTPSNILLTREGVPKVTDFGLARRLDTATRHTQTGALLGTPSYMAPEQAAGLEASVATDVHALGAILYGAITGCPPYQAATPLEILEAVRTQEPEPPRRLRSGIPRDLQTICLKCLEKDPARRYATAAGLADDLARFRRGEPIQARRASATERLARWVRRRPYRAAFVALAGLSVVGAFSGLIVHQRRLQVEIDRANEAARTASDQKAFAEASYREARKALLSLLDWASEPRFRNSPQSSELLRFQHERALTFFAQILDHASPSDPSVRFDTAQAAHEAANLNLWLGRNVEAQKHLRQALDLLRPLRARAPEDPGPLDLEISCWGKLGLALAGPENPTPDSLEALRHAAALTERYLRLRPGSSEGRARMAWCAHNLGWTLQGLGQAEEAEEQTRKAVDLYRTLRRERSDDPASAEHLAGSITQLGQMRLIAGDSDAASACFQEAEGLLQECLRTDPDARVARSTLAELQIAQGNLASERGNLTLAEEHHRRGLEAVAPLLDTEPTNRSYRRAAMALHGSLANLYTHLPGHADEQLTEGALAIELADDPATRRGLTIAQAVRLARTSRYAEGVQAARATAAEIDEAAEGVGADLYNLACVAALASAAARSDERVDASRRAEQAESYAVEALGYLSRASAIGFFRDPAYVDHAHRDTDLAALHGREDFRSLIPPPPAP